MAVRQNKAGKWVADFYLGEIRLRPEFRTKAEAVQFMQDSKASYRSGMHIPAKVLNTTADKILTYHMAQGGRAGGRYNQSQFRSMAPLVKKFTLKYMTRNVPAMKKFWFEDVRRKCPDVSQSTLHNWRAFLKAAVKTFMVDHSCQNLGNPFEWPFPTGKKPREVRHGEEWYRRLVDVARNGKRENGQKFDPDLWRLLVCMWSTGRREFEVISWERNRACIDCEIINGVPRPWPWVETPTFKQKKILKWRKIPLIDLEAWEALKGTTGTDKRFFRWNSRPNQLTELYRVAGCPHLRPHDFRRDWKHRYSNLPQKLRMDYQGHLSQEMDDHYMVSTYDDFVAAMCKPNWSSQ